MYARNFDWMECTSMVVKVKTGERDMLRFLHKSGFSESGYGIRSGKNRI